MKTLILYYSHGGNTRKAAELIHERIGGDIAEIETVEPYTGGHDAVIKTAKEELAAGFLPEIKPLVVNIDDYETIILGSPIWWYTLPQVLMTALPGVTWAGKVIWPFVTHGGDGAGDAFEKLQNTCAGAEVKPVLDVYFTYMTNEFPDTSRKSLENWADGIQ